MQFRRNGACDQRRRRVLIEENLLETELDEDSALPATRTANHNSADCGLQSYTDAAQAERLPPITAVIPRRGWTLAALALAGLAVIAGLEALYGKIHLSPVGIWPAELRAFDVQGRGGLATWFSSLMLALAALQGIQIYRIRRHKANDYRGRYRLWLWVPLALFSMAMCVATHLHHDLAVLASQAYAVVAPADESLLWPVVYCAAWSLFSLRLAFEVRESRVSLASLCLSTCCYFGAAVMVVVPNLVPDPVVSVIVTTAAAMLGHLATFFTVAAYGRHVYLDSQGLVPARVPSQELKETRKRKSVQSRTREDDEAEPVSSKDHPKGGSSKKAIRTRVAKDLSAEADASSSTVRDRSDQVADVIAMSDAQPEILDGEPPENRKLSKAERRRLRKQRRREQARKAA